MVNTQSQAQNDSQDLLIRKSVEEARLLSHSENETPTQTPPDVPVWALIIVGLAVESANFCAFSAVDIFNYFLPGFDPEFGVSIGVALGNVSAVLLSFFIPPKVRYYPRVGIWASLSTLISFFLVALILPLKINNSFKYFFVVLLFFIACFLQTYCMAYVYHLGGIVFGSKSIEHLQQGGVLGAFGIYAVRAAAKGIIDGSEANFITSTWIFFGVTGVLIASGGYLAFRKLMGYAKHIQHLETLIEDDPTWRDMIATYHKSAPMLWLSGMTLCYTVFYFPGVASILHGSASHDWSTLLVIGSFLFGDFVGKVLVTFITLTTHGNRSVFRTFVFHLILSVFIILISQNYATSAFWGSPVVSCISFMLFGVSNGLTIASAMKLALEYPSLSEEEIGLAGALGNFFIQTGFFFGTLFSMVAIKPILYPSTQ